MAFSEPERAPGKKILKIIHCIKSYRIQNIAHQVMTLANKLQKTRHCPINHRKREIALKVTENVTLHPEF